MFARLKKAIKILINYKSATPLSKNDQIQAARVKHWFLDNGDKTLRLDYDLNTKSIVFDVGGYKGDFTADMFCKYNCNFYVFEPVSEFYEIIERKFSNNHKVKTFAFGLAHEEKFITISLEDNASSIYLSGKKSETIELKSIVEFVRQESIAVIDLVKINIEGGEYDLLEALLNEGEIKRFKNIQVQFHDFLFDNAEGRMEMIQARLSETHDLTYQYKFVWENWKLK